jgi:hypothetical protein
MIMSRRGLLTAIATVAGIVVAAGAVLATAPTGTAAPTAEQPGSGAVTGVAELPALGLAEFQNGLLPGSVDEDRGIALGSIGSDLYHGPGDAAGEYWAVTDRGPNAKVGDRRTFGVPAFDPAIVHLRADGGTLSIVSATPVTGPDGAPVSGLPNVAGYDETPYDYTGEHELSRNPDGLDPEGLVRAPDGTFWLAEEYGPSLVHVDADGTVLTRYVPKGWQGTGQTYPVEAVLPGILLRRHANHGFEGLALDPDGRTLYAAVQGPLDNPDAQQGEDSRNGRVLRFDVGTDTVTGEFVRRFEKVCDVDEHADCGKDQGDLTDSSIAALAPGSLLVGEHTDDAARLFAADLAGATDILGSRWDDPSTSPSLEELDKDGLADADVAPLGKRLVADLDDLGLPGKIEGVAVLDASTIAVANDNDFGVGGFDGDGNVVDTGVRSRVWTIKPAALGS